MKIGYNQATGWGCSTLEADLSLCEKTGFDYIEIRLDMLKAFLEKHTLGELQVFFQNSHIKPHALNAMYLYQDLFHKRDDAQRQADFMELFHFACQSAAAIGSYDLVVVPPLGQSGYMEPYHDVYGTVVADCVRILQSLAPLAEAYGVRLALEPVGAGKSSVRTAEAAQQIIQAVNLRNVGLTIDAANLYVNGKLKGFSGIRKLQADNVFVVHINDYDDLPLERFTLENRCFCGQGVIPLRDYLDALKEIGYAGMVSIEVFRPAYWQLSPQEVIRAAYNSTMKFLQPYYGTAK